MDEVGDAHTPGTHRRTGASRDRHGRGMRGLPVLAGPLTPNGPKLRRNRQERFDALVLEVVHSLESRWKDELGLVEFAVEETPMIPDDWAAPTVPLASVVPGSGTEPSKLVVFRRPIELRCETSADLPALLLTVMVEQVSELLGRPPDEIDPRYDAG